MINSINILIVEDNPGDARLIDEALNEGKIVNTSNHVDDGAKALAYLRKEGAYADKQKPDLILLDLNLPKIDGREVLEQIKKDAKLCKIPVIILTTSENEDDVAKSYELHANCYIRKPVEYDVFLRVVKTIEDFWLSTVILPNGG